MRPAQGPRPFVHTGFLCPDCPPPVGHCGSGDWGCHRLWQPLLRPWREALCPSSLGQALSRRSARPWLLPLEVPSLTPLYPQCTEAGSCARVRRQGGRLAGEGRFLSPAPTP